MSKKSQKKTEVDVNLGPIRQEYNFYLKEIEKLYGKKAKEVLEILLYYFKNNKRISENKIAKILNEDVNVIRKILYHFQNEGIVFSKFWKINKKGWQINSWHIDFKNLDKMLTSQISSFKSETHDSDFFEDCEYVCLNCNKYFSEKEALENNYTCECGEFLVNRKDHSYDVDKEKETKSFIAEEFI